MKTNNDYRYIDKFKAISIREICKDLHLDPSNLYAHRMHPYHVHKVRMELERQVNNISEYKPHRKFRSKRKRIKKKHAKRHY